MDSFGDRTTPQYLAPSNRARKIFLYTVYIIGLLAIGAATVSLIDPIYIIGAAVAIAVVFAIIKYPFFGFMVYLAVYFLRPGERFFALGALRLELAAGALLLIILIISDAMRGRGIRFPKDRISIAIIVFIGVMCTSMVFSEWVTQSYDAVVKTIKIFILYYFVVVLVDTEKRFQIVLWLVILFTCFVGIEASANYFMGNYKFEQGVMRAEGQTSYGRNFNGLAMYMATTLPLLFYMLSRNRKIVIRTIGLGLIGACLLTLAITGSRSGLLCLITAALVFICFSRHRLFYFIIIIIMALAIWTVLPDQYRTRYGTMTEGEIDASTRGRINAWRAGMEMFLEKPIFGVGPAVFAAAYFDRKGVWLSSHSLYVEAIATLGIVGSVSWGSFLFLFLVKLRRIRKWPVTGRRRIIDTDIYTRSVYAIIAGLLIAGIFGHILFRDTWYIMAGLTVARDNLLTNEGESS